jgi:hypothetical protein
MAVHLLGVEDFMRSRDAVPDDGQGDPSDRTTTDGAEVQG